ncbi:MAG: hypothetical protein GQE15_19770 [Archangiaceae bacterium]|nr:hypothetical protein [Archangiaceae bacterium]
MKWMSYVMVALLVPALARGQTSGFSPPPLIPAPPPAAPDPNGPPPAPPVDSQYGTPAPPTNTPPAKPYMPYGNQAPKEPPGPEVGLMVSESLFGMLTAAGILVLPFFLLINGGLFSGDPVVGTVITALLFGSAPLAIAQTQVSIANGSRNYYSEMWPAALAGLAAQAAVLGLTYLTGGGAIVRNTITCPAGTPTTGSSVPTGCGNDVVLLVGAIVAVPLIQMAVLNLTKQPRFKSAIASRDPKSGALSIGLPTPTPLIGPTSSGFSVGASVSLIDWRF